MRHFAQIQKEFLRYAFIDPFITFDTFIRGKKFIHPNTRNQVEFYSLPKSMQHMIKSHWNKRQNDVLMRRIQDTAKRKEEVYA